MRALIRHHGPSRARRRLVQARGIHRLCDVVDDLRSVPTHLVLVFFVVEGHAHQRLPECIAIGRIEIVIVIAVCHDAAAGADIHSGLVPFGGGGLPCLAPLRGAAGHRPVADGEGCIESAGNVVAADKTVFAAIEVPVDVEIVDGGIRPARTHERIEMPAFEEQGGAGAGLVTVVLTDDAFLCDRIVGLADAGEQHQVHVVDGIGAQQHQAGGLLELLAVE